jgi:hypothetical protein
MIHVTGVEYRGGHVLRLRFSDGATGDVDLQPHLAGPVLAPLRDRARFASAYVDEELGTVVWPGGADVAPEFLYAAALAGRAVAEGD